MTPTTSRAFLITVLLAFSDLLCAGLNAQVSDSILSGTVVDVSQAAIPNVRVTLTNVSTGVARTVSTDPAGLYTLANLPPASYEMTAASMGFTTQVRTDITLDLGAKLVLNVVMEAGDPNQVIRVSVSESPADSASSAAGGNVSSSTVLDSPLNGRDWTQLATLQAGVTGVQTGTAEGGGNMERGFGAALSISGARPDQNSYRLDGVSINDYSNGAPGSVLGDNLGVDAVQQFSVLGSNYPAQYGRTTGGVINAVTRSGTNASHGSVYEFLRNSALDARNFFDARIPPFKRNLTGKLFRRSFLLFQPGLECLLLQIQMRQVARGIDEGIRAALPQLRVLVLEKVEAAMRSEKNVAWQRAKDLEAAHVIVNDLRIFFAVHQNVAQVVRIPLQANAAEDYHVVRLPAVLHLHGPSSTAPGVARREVGHQGDASQRDLVAVVQDPVDRMRFSSRTQLL